MPPGRLGREHGGGPMNVPTTAGEWPVNFTRDSVRTMFILFAVFWWVGYALLIAGIGVLFLIAAIVFDCILLYRHWLLLQGHGARTTPGKAVGFGFIPFYCFYWWFVAYPGLATDNNRYMDEAGIPGARLSRGLGIAICVLGILDSTVGLHPVVGIILLVPCAVVGFLFVLQQKNCILAILERRMTGSDPMRG